MKFSAHDETYNALIETAGHELYIATQNRSTFDFLRDLLTENKSRDVKVACYQAYAEFVRGLYEYYLAVLKLNENTTSWPKNYDKDEKINDAVQRLLNFQRPFRSVTNPRYPINVPNDFGSSFRNIRNRVSHADFRRMLFPEKEINSSLSTFYKEYDIYVKLLLESPQFTWGGRHYEDSYKWNVIDEFIVSVSNGA